MTSRELAKAVGCSTPWIYHLKKKYSDRCPKDFNDVAGWKALLAFSRTETAVYRTPKKLKNSQSNGDGLELSDIARLTRARANKVETEHEILSIELAATKRSIVREEEIIALFAKLSVVLRGRLMKMAADLPNMLLGLDAPAIDAVVREKLEEVLATLVLPKDLFEPRGIV